MNKLFTKVATLSIGLALAIGVGVAVGSKDVKEARADDVTYDLTINGSNFNTTSYAANNNEKTSNAVCTTDNTKTFEVKWTSYQVMKNGNNMQWQKSKGYIYNSTDLGTINSVTVNSSAGTFTTYYGTSEQPSSGSSGSGKGFFKTSVGSDTGTTSSVVVRFTISSGSSKTATATTISTEDDTTVNYNGTVHLSAAVTYGGSTAVPGASVTYASSDSTIASVNETTGVVTASSSKPGTVTITATYAGNDTYEGSSDTIAIKVQDPNAITVTPADLSDMSTTAGEVSATYNGITFSISSGLRDSGNLHVRIYKNATLTISCARNIKSIDFTGVSGNPASNMTLTSGGGEYTTSDNNGSWAGTSKELVFTASANQARISQFVIVLEALTPISSLAIDATHSMYEGQTWTPTVTYNQSATIKTSEIVIVSGSEYIEIIDGTSVKAKQDSVTTSAKAYVKAHATDVESSEVYSEPCEITINNNTVTGVSITQAPTKTEYVEGQNLVLSGLVLSITWNVGSTTINSQTGYEGVTTTPSLSTALTVSAHNGIKVAVSYGGQTTEANAGFQISVVAKAVSSITAWNDVTTSYQTGSTLIADGTLAVTYNDETPGELDVATLWNNSEATFHIGSGESWTSVTPGTTTMISDYNGLNLRITYSGLTRYITLSVRVFNIQFLKRITSISQLTSGSTYVIGGRISDSLYLLPASAAGLIPAELNSNAWFNDTFGSESIDSMKADLSSYAYTITSVNGVTNGYTLVDANSKYIGWANPSSSKTSLSSYASEQSDGKTTWTITQDTYGYGTFRAISYAGNKDRILALADSKTSVSQKFGAYSASNMTSTKHDDNNNYYYLLEIYQIADTSNSELAELLELDDPSLDSIISNYVDDVTCDGLGNYSFKGSSTWSTISSCFDDLSIEEKAYLKHASYSISGSGIQTQVSGTNGTSAIVASFVSRYDYMVDKYELTDFIHRNGTEFDLFNSHSVHFDVLNTVGNSSTTLVIITVSIVGVAAMGGYFLFRKKKQN